MKKVVHTKASLLSTESPKSVFLSGVVNLKECRAKALEDP